MDNVKQVGKYTVRVENDDYPYNPREDDNVGKMICFHNRYDLGDKHDYDHRNYSGWDEMKCAIIKNENACVILPLYLYDHSGITMSISPFSCRWDSGQVGFIVATKEKVREEYDLKRVSASAIVKAQKLLEGEVETYDKYLRGEIYRCVIEEDGEYVDSLNGYDDEDDCMAEGVAQAEYFINQEKTNKNLVD